MWPYVRVAVGTVAVVIPVATTFFDKVGCHCSINGVSMQPVINPDWPRAADFIFINKMACRDFTFKRGEIVCLTSPHDSSQKLIKRIVALEGDVVIPRKKTTGGAQSILIQEGYCWVEGDNTARSKDSNRFGPVPVGLIYAKANYIIWPPHRWQRLDTEEVESDRVRTPQQRKKESSLRRRQLE